MHQVLLRLIRMEHSVVTGQQSFFLERTASNIKTKILQSIICNSKKDRATIAEKEKEAQKQKQMEYEAKRLAKERRRQTLRLVEESVKKDLEKAKVLNIDLYLKSVFLSMNSLYENIYFDYSIA